MNFGILVAAEALTRALLEADREARQEPKPDERLIFRGTIMCAPGWVRDDPGAILRAVLDGYAVTIDPRLIGDAWFIVRDSK
mgnify:CR=1 FL=1